jgi:hypothetical protein
MDREVERERGRDRKRERFIYNYFQARCQPFYLKELAENAGR